MLKTLKLTNFKAHESLEINFSEGLQVIRGANEAGKSSLYHAIAYAFYGSRALPLSLEETVTWGKPESSLKVELTFTNEGTEFHIVRKKSGAELTGPGVTASGHAEVTAFVERLFKASAAVGTATMLAMQNALRGNLDKGSVALIEKLSNMGLIDEIVKKIQEKLPSGNTKSLEAQLAGYADLAQPILETMSLDEAITAAEQAKQVADFAATVAAEAVQANREAVANVQAKARLAQATRQRQEALQKRLTELVCIEVPPAPAGRLEDLQQAAGRAREAKVLAAAKQAFDALPIRPVQMTTVEFMEAHSAAVAKKNKASADATAAKVSIARLEATKITQTACGLCGKDLSEVPEVVATNARIDAELLQLNAAKAKALADEADAKVEVKRLEDLDRLNTQIENSAGKQVIVDKLVVPFQLLWAGGEVPDVAVELDYDAAIRDWSKAQSAHANAVLVNNNIVSQQAAVTAELASLVIDEVTENEEALVAEQAALVVQDEQCKVEALAALRRVDAANAAKQSAIRAHDVALNAYLDAQEKKQKLMQLIATQIKHNQLIDKLREVRPIVVKRLWNLVLTGVSNTFSTIRGTRSTVSRGDDGFLIDGKPAEAYSGSTKDSLGLAIRITLQKTFLGSLDMMLIDEPAAAFDDVRESDMLAVLSSCNIRQVVLVTHSDLADTFATNVITI